jgi:hypothetical protein
VLASQYSAPVLVFLIIFVNLKLTTRFVGMVTGIVAQAGQPDQGQANKEIDNKGDWLIYAGCVVLNKHGRDCSRGMLVITGDQFLIALFFFRVRRV